MLHMYNQNISLLSIFGTALIAVGVIVIWMGYQKQKSKTVTRELVDDLEYVVKSDDAKASDIPCKECKTENICKTYGCRTTKSNINDTLDITSEQTYIDYGKNENL